jgi:hypothetical protein
MLLCAGTGKSTRPSYTSNLVLCVAMNNVLPVEASDLVVDNQPSHHFPGLGYNIPYLKHQPKRPTNCTKGHRRSQQAIRRRKGAPKACIENKQPSACR